MRVILSTAIFWLAALSSAAAQFMILRSTIVATPRSPSSDRGWPMARRVLEIAWAQQVHYEPEVAEKVNDRIGSAPPVVP